MEIKIIGAPEEIAALVVAIQGRREDEPVDLFEQLVEAGKKAEPSPLSV